MLSRAGMAQGAIVLMLWCAAAPEARGAQPLYSALWGKEGERWKPGGRLPDFSYAGYRMGEAPLPKLPVKANVKTFGAKGDGETDDTKAFQDAIAKTRGGALFVPPGKYVITDFLEIKKSHFVLRGAGPDKSILYFPKSLNDIKPNWGATTSGRRTSNYSWSGGFVVIRSSFGRKRLGKVVQSAKRGDKILVLDQSPGLRVGDRVDVRQRDTSDNSLAKHLYNGQPGTMDKLRGRTRTSFVSRVVAVQGKQITLERPLRSDVDPRWNAEVYAFAPRVTDSGVEELCFEFPVSPYKGHFTELGYNPVAIGRAAHCWIRNIRVVNADSGPYVAGRFCTVSGIVIESQRQPDRSGCTGHHGISCSGDDNLVERFDIRTKFIHDITVSRNAGNVFRRGRGVDLSFDHHKKAPHANLFTDIDLGEGRRMYKCGGGAALGRNCGAWGTFWNIRARQLQRLPPPRFGPDLLNFVGIYSNSKAIREPEGKWWEPIPPALLWPRDLYEAQLNKRLGRTRNSSQRQSPKTATSGAKAGRRIPRPPAPPRPVASPEILAQRDAKLKARVAEALAAGRRVRFRLASLRRVADVKDLDRGGRMNVSAGGLEAGVAFDKLKLNEKRSLAASLASHGAPEDIALAAFYCLALGNTEAANVFLARLPPAQVSKVRSAFR